MNVTSNANRILEGRTDPDILPVRAYKILNRVGLPSWPPARAFPRHLHGLIMHTWRDFADV